ncbi:unnamed protein product, partial [Amoebophrya sp. A25]|eukprot:GSA25T00015388001.1
MRLICLGGGLAVWFYSFCLSLDFLVLADAETGTGLQDTRTGGVHDTVTTTIEPRADDT